MCTCEWRALLSSLSSLPSRIPRWLQPNWINFKIFRWPFSPCSSFQCRYYERALSLFARLVSLSPQLRFKIQNTLWSWIAIVILFVVVLFYFKNYPLKRGELRQCAMPSHGWKITTTTINKNWSDQCNGLSVDRDYDCRVIKEIYLQNARISLLLRLFCFWSLVYVCVRLCGCVLLSFRFFFFSWCWAR